MTQPNPYTTNPPPTFAWESDKADSGRPNADYAVETEGTENGNRWYLRVLGWAPRLRPGGLDTPDAMRDGTQAVRDMRPNPVRPPQETYEGYRGRETNLRHSTVEDQDADGWEERKEGSGRPAAPNPRTTPPPEPRPTSRMAPRSYSFTRPFDQHAARTFNGVHFSMADNARTYDIMGMVPPQHVSRNTYRLPPSPWDKDIVDAPPPMSPQPYERVVATDVAPAGNRAWRLG